MSDGNLIFLENIEWFDESGKEILHRLPAAGSAEIKYGAQLTVRESQAAVFFYQGKAVGVFGSGRHTLKTANIPILNKIASIPWAMKSPLRAEVYFLSLKVFTNLKWGTRDPVAFKDSELGLIRLRAFGIFNIRVVQPVLFINTMAGTQGIFTTEAIEGYLNQVIVSRFNDYMGEHIDTILNLASQYDEISKALSKRLENDFSRFGLQLAQLYLNAVTPPPEVQTAIDDRSRMGVLKDMGALLKMKAAMAIEKAAETENSSLGMGMGLMMPAMFNAYFSGTPTASPTMELETRCPECANPVPADARFCPSCGHQQVIFNQCAHCGKNLPPTARFCPRCGQPTEKKPTPLKCHHCGAENLSDAVFCIQCGERN